MKYPQASFKLFDINLKKSDPQDIGHQLYNEFQSIFAYYKINVSRSKFIEAITYAVQEYEKLQTQTAGIAADFIEEAIDKKLNISIINAREYILNPGIYDSHIGKLLKDKGVVAIPTYVFDTYPDNKFDHIYWKNPHDLLTKSSAISHKQLHQIIKHPQLKKLIKKIETGNTGSLLSIVTVSTFRCGPDSITLPLLAEITKDIPSLLIQSDAMIAQLAHLENRVNTHLNQLNKSLHDQLSRENEKTFSIELLGEFSLDNLQKETDAIYFPTMNDNRAVTSVFRAAGLTVIDNYDDDTYSLEEKAKIGGKYVGNSVCVPLAAVFSDMFHAVEDFISRKEADDPLVKGKKRVVLFMQTGDGPCRHGQYIEMCKLNLYRVYRNPGKQTFALQDNHLPIKFLESMATESHDKKDFISEIEKWAAIQGYHAVVIKGVLHSIYLKASSNCRNFEEFEKLKLDYRKLKQHVHEMLEFKVKPGSVSRFIVDKIERWIPKLGGIAQYFGYGLFNNNGLRKIFKDFRDKWIQNHTNGTGLKNAKTKIHVEGEIYLRVAQVEEIFKCLVDTLGFGSFELAYTPIWSHPEYVLEAKIIAAAREIKILEDILKLTGEKKKKKRLMNLIKEQKRRIKGAEKSVNSLRNVLAGPLYKAAGLKMPHKVKQAIAAAQPVLPKFKPFGELVPYVGETISLLNDDTDLVLNVAPEGCMVASMGEMLTPQMMQWVNNKKARIQNLFTTEGEINEDLLKLSLLKILGPEKFYSNFFPNPPSKKPPYSENKK